MFFFAWTVIPIIISALLVVNLFLMPKNFLKSKMSIYECGFAPKFSARLPFSLRFFLLALLFLIFDVELTLVVIFPMIHFTSLYGLSMALFCLFLFFGLFHEWNEGSLSWIK